MYMRDVTASLVRPVKELKGFRRMELEAGQAREVCMELMKQDMGFYNDQGEYILESGSFRIYAGGNSRDCLSEEISLCF